MRFFTTFIQEIKYHHDKGESSLDKTGHWTIYLINCGTQKETALRRTQMIKQYM